MTDGGPDALAAALDYAQRGLDVFPLRGKMPAISADDGGHGLHDGTTDANQIITWFDAMGFTNVGVAIPTGFAVIDIDTQHDGPATWKRWIDEGRDVSATKVAPRQRTGNGGFHVWMRYDGPKLAYKRKEFSGIEMSQRGRYLVMAPSVHPDTHKTYYWEVPLPECFDEIPVLPDWLVELYYEDVSLAPSATRTLSSGDDDLDVAVHRYTGWGDVLGEDQWKLVRGDGSSDGSVWRHPTATAKQSATIKYGCLFVYSPNTRFPETTYSDPHGVTLFSAFAAIRHSGDFKRAAGALRDSGYLEARVVSTDPRELVVAPSGTRTATLVVTVPADTVTIVDANGTELLVGEAPDALGTRVHWPTFWLQEEDDTERWLSEPILAWGRAHALYAGAKTGKSLLMLQCAAALATGRPFLDKPPTEPVSVVYCDYEMIEEDLLQRLEQFGYGPDIDLDALSYYFLGSGRALDTYEGGAALVQTAFDRQAKLVIVDTTARAVGGAENDADTLRAFYRFAGVDLKRNGSAWMRIDHSGKDIEKGQRGSSAKNDDVDIVWQLGPAGGDGQFDLTATHQRMGWVPKKVKLALHQEDDGDGDVVEWRRREERTFGPKVKETAWLLDELGCAPDISKRHARDALRAATPDQLNRTADRLKVAHNGGSIGEWLRLGWKGRDEVILHAFAWRRNDYSLSDLVAGTTQEI